MKKDENAFCSSFIHHLFRPNGWRRERRPRGVTMATDVRELTKQAVSELPEDEAAEVLD
jgi:hypothetical protein